MFGDTRCIIFLSLPAVWYNQLYPSYHFQMISAVFVVHVHCRVAEKEIEAMPICVNLWICKYSHKAKPLKKCLSKTSEHLFSRCYVLSFNLSLQPLSDRRDASGHIGVTPFWILTLNQFCIRQGTQRKSYNSTPPQTNDSHNEIIYLHQAVMKAM